MDTTLNTKAALSIQKAFKPHSRNTNGEKSLFLLALCPPDDWFRWTKIYQL